MLTKLMTLLLVVALVAPAAAQATPDADVWRTFASRLEVGTRIKLQLRDGQRVSATLIQAGADDIIVQPRTRRIVPTQHVPYDAIALIERDDARGMGAAKAVAIGVAAGAGVFLGILLLIAASLD
jgi:hypothetical protein